MKRFLVGLLLLAGVSACDLTEPHLLSLEIIEEFLPAETGCGLRLNAVALGIGEFQWDRVAIATADGIVAEYVGAETAEFWGQSHITAGEELASIVLDIPDPDVPLQSLFEVSSSRGARTLVVTSVCPAPEV
jgi:hypothetical protein